MAAKVLAVVTVLCCVLAFAGCDSDDRTGLFPDFLTEISRAVYVGDYFNDPGNDFFFYLIPPGTGGTYYQDLLVMIQKLDNGDRKVAFFDEQLNRISTSPQNAVSPKLGSMHIKFSGDDLLIGTTQCTIQTTPLPVQITFDADFTLNDPDDELRDKIVLDTGTQYVIIVDSVYNQTSGTAFINYREYDYATGSINTGTLSSQVLFPTGKFLVPEAAMRFAQPNLVLRDENTGEGFINQWSTGQIDYRYSLEPSHIAAGSAQFTADGQLVFQAADGRLYRFNPDGGYYGDNTNASAYGSYLLAYGGNSAMYVFNPTSRQLMKSRPWWEY